MKVISCNLNGIRSAHQKGFWAWLVAEKPDVVCLQEVRADLDKIPPEIKDHQGFYSCFRTAKKPGYSGVAILSKKKPDKIVTEMGLEPMDEEGRFLQFDFKNLSILSLYFPSGTSGEKRQVEKYRFMETLETKMKGFLKKKKPFILCGDFNIAHKKMDIKNWKSNQKNSGFLPEERAWMDKIIEQWGYVDAFREKNKNAEEYSWWSNRGRAYENNVGWRIDYHLTSPDLKSKIKKASIYREKKFSDHAPVVVDYAQLF